MSLNVRSSDQSYRPMVSRFWPQMQITAKENEIASVCGNRYATLWLPNPSPDGGIGRRVGFKIRCPLDVRVQVPLRVHSFAARLRLLLASARSEAAGTAAWSRVTARLRLLRAPGVRALGPDFAGLSGLDESLVIERSQQLCDIGRKDLGVDLEVLTEPV